LFFLDIPRSQLGLLKLFIDIELRIELLELKLESLIRGRNRIVNENHVESVDEMDVRVTIIARVGSAS